MARFNGSIVLALVSTFAAREVAGDCLDPSTASISEGAWNLMGVNGTWVPDRRDENNINTQNPSWTIPDGTWKYPHGEMGSRGPNYRTQYTCTKLTFCNPEGGDVSNEAAGGRRKLQQATQVQQAVTQFSQQDVWKLKDKASFDACDFTDAELVGTTSPTSCVEVEKDDRTMDGEKNYYASRENCAAGQKLAVVISDWETSASQCEAIALHVPASSRLRSCDCAFEKVEWPGRYAALCAYAYQEACFSVMNPDDDCCEKGTCMSKLEVFDSPEGELLELNRRESCNDEIPGNCYNMNGFATDVSQDGPTDCCSQTCSTCGPEIARGASFEMCTSNDPDTMTAKCGRLSRYAQEDFVCDFSKCPENSYWGKNNDAIWKYMGLEKPKPQVDPPVVVTVDIPDPAVQNDNMAKESGASALSLSLVSFSVVFLAMAL